MPTCRLRWGYLVSILLVALGIWADMGCWKRAAAVRWLGRYALEAPDVGLEEIGVALGALDQLPESPATRGALARIVT